MIFRCRVSNCIVINAIAGLVLSACTLHDNFPFICFRKSCVDSGIDLKGFKKRIKGSLALSKRKRGKKQNGRRQGEIYGQRARVSEPDSLDVTRGRNIDYYRYLLLFKLKKNPWHLDSLVVEHTSEYKTIIELDQVRVDHKIDSLLVKNILFVYIKKFYAPDPHDTEIVANKRVRAIKKYLHNSGISAKRIKFIDDGGQFDEN